MHANLGGFFTVRVYYQSEYQDDYFTFARSWKRWAVVMEEAYFTIHKMNISIVKLILLPLKVMTKRNKLWRVIAEVVEGEPHQTVVANKRRCALSVAEGKALGLGDRRK